MAIIKLGTTVVGIRGKFGGGIYSANKGGPYVRTYNKASAPTSPRAFASRANMGKVPGGWQALSTAQRDAWDAYAADSRNELTNSLGESYFASGWNWFMRTAMQNKFVATIETAPSTLPRIADPTGVTTDFRTSASGDPCEIDLNTSVPAGGAAAVQLALLQRKTIATTDANFKFVGTFAPSAGIIDVSPFMPSRFGSWTDEIRFIARIWIRSLTTPWSLYPTTWVADVT